MIPDAKTPLLTWGLGQSVAEQWDAARGLS